MKQKGNNINIFKNNQKTKGLIFLTLLFFGFYCPAQKTIKKSIKTKVENVIVEFNMIDQLELVSSNSTSEVLVISKNENTQSPTVILEEKNGTLFIKSLENATSKEVFEIDKLCAIQPIYSSFQIRIPKNKNVQVIIAKGNFLAENFYGKLDLKLQEGIVKIDNFNGEIVVTIHNGKVSCNDIHDTELEVNSNIGQVSTNFQLKNAIQNEQEVIGLFGRKINRLKIDAIMANIELSAHKN